MYEDIMSAPLSFNLSLTSNLLASFLSVSDRGAEIVHVLFERVFFDIRAVAASSTSTMPSISFFDGRSLGLMMVMRLDVPVILLEAETSKMLLALILKVASTRGGQGVYRSMLACRKGC